MAVTNTRRLATEAFRSIVPQVVSEL